MSEKLKISEVAPLLNKIAECFDEYLESEEKVTVEFSEAVELMHDIVEDNEMFIRN